MARIFIVGSATGLGFARAGNQVTFVDFSAERRPALAARGPAVSGRWPKSLPAGGQLTPN